MATRFTHYSVLPPSVDNQQSNNTRLPSIRTAIYADTYNLFRSPTSQSQFFSTYSSRPGPQLYASLPPPQYNMASYMQNGPAENHSAGNHSAEDNVSQTIGDVRQLAAETAEIIVTKKTDAIQRRQDRRNEDLDRRQQGFEARLEALEHSRVRKTIVVDRDQYYATLSRLQELEAENRILQARSPRPTLY